MREKVRETSCAQERKRGASCHKREKESERARARNLKLNERDSMRKKSQEKQRNREREKFNPAALVAQTKQQNQTHDFPHSLLLLRFLPPPLPKSHDTAFDNPFQLSGAECSLTGDYCPETGQHSHRNRPATSSAHPQGSTHPYPCDPDYAAGPETGK